MHQTRLIRFGLVLPGIFLLLFGFGGMAQSAAPVTSYRLQRVVGGFQSPVAVIQAPDGSDRLFVVELTGKIRIVQAGQILTAPFLDLTSLATVKIFGQGLFDLAFDPDYSHNRFVYVYYVNLNGDSVLERYTTAAADPNVADPQSAKILLIVPNVHGFHYGGQLAFGPDGYLYVSSGDGGSPFDKDGNAQNPGSLLGAILRLDVAHGDPYAIPADNPFVSNPAARPELWAKGLRNPWRFSFDSLTGDLIIADAGEATYEELDFQPAGDKGGENYGWNKYEGTVAINGGSKAGLTFPIAEYTHVNHNCVVIGGYVYRGTALPDQVGKYIFADYCSGTVWTLQLINGTWKMATLLQSDLRIAGFGQDASGELYAADLKTNAIYRLIKAG